MSNIVSSLEWRYATKKFDENKEVSALDIEKIKDVLRLTPSSFWLQPWKFILISNKEIQASLVEQSWGQKQVLEASHVLIFARKNTLDESFVQEYIDDYLETIGAPAETLDWYKDMMNGVLSGMSEDDKAIWADKQIYIALWNAMTALADMQIDSCPMEGFLAPKYDEILWLGDKWLSSVVVLPIGYRAEDDKHATDPKIRFKNKDLFIEM